MAMRIITGPVNDVTGLGIPAGTVVIMPLAPAGTAADGFIVQASEFPILNGAFSAAVVVPGSYRLEVYDADGRRLRSFNANVDGGSAADVSLKELWECRLDSLDQSAGVMCEGASVLRRISGGGTPGQELETALEGARLKGFSEYAVICDRRPTGTHGGFATALADTRRTLNTVLFNGSGLSDSALLNIADSSVTLLSGRAYYGWASAPATTIGGHVVCLKSTDNTINVMGRGQVTATGGMFFDQSYSDVEFHIAVATGGSNKAVQLFHRLTRDTGGIAALGQALQSMLGNTDVPEEFSRITIFSRPL